VIAPGDIISYIQMCDEEGASLQRGMNFRLKGRTSIILMSLRRGAPYSDRVEENGKILIYEGHDVPLVKDGPSPKQVDQQAYLSNKRATQNGLFFEAAAKYKKGETSAEVVKVYEKIRDGIWAFDGFFLLTDCWKEESGNRRVFKFKLTITTQASPKVHPERDLSQNRLIPTDIKLEVWKRDGGQVRPVRE
jgi:hypothetical protein